MEEIVEASDLVVLHTTFYSRTNNSRMKLLVVVVPIAKITTDIGLTTQCKTPIKNVLRNQLLSFDFVDADKAPIFHDLTDMVDNWFCIPSELDAVQRATFRC